MIEYSKINCGSQPVVDDEMEAMSRSSLCVQKRNENDSDISLSFSYSLS